MKYSIDAFIIKAVTDEEKRAACLFADELESRTGKRPDITANGGSFSFGFFTTEMKNKDSFSVEESNGAVCVYAQGIRGFIYGFSLLLRKSVFKDGTFETVCGIAGDYAPRKEIRGHQLGYRTTPNTYDAWSYEDYRRYYLDIMFAGCNTVEHIPYESGKSCRNRLMKYDEEEFLVEACRMADELDLDVSLWYPNADGETDESAAQTRKKLVEKLPRVNVIFPPGGDPGNLPADEFLRRCRAISKSVKSVSEEIKIFPSAQAPHGIDNWGEEFIKSLEKDSKGIDGIIMGPNHAFPLDVLREKVPAHLPIRFYPDITHNLRCEYPVHFEKDDWHYALCAGLSRECTNPRPLEYARLHSLTKDYVCGSVSYSEGITDDVNKFVWSGLDFDDSLSVKSILQDYARLFFAGVPADFVADAVLRLEANWEGDPAENDGIDETLDIFKSLSEKYSFLNDNWRFNQLLFRAECDWLIRHRRIFENSLIEKAQALVKDGMIREAKAVLLTNYADEYKAVRKNIDSLAALLFDEIGLQLDVEHYCADNPERGAVLDTIDLPVTDRAWLLNRFEYAEKFDGCQKTEFLKRVFTRNTVAGDEFYFSVAENGIAGTNSEQTGEIYINVQADRPDVNNGQLPCCMFKVFDNYSFRLAADGFSPGTAYRLIVTFADRNYEKAGVFRITANGNTVYEGELPGGKSDKAYDEQMLCGGFMSREYFIPSNVFTDSRLDLVMEEKKIGVMISELKIIKA
ncbi:MAG: hypothetical protein IJK60_05280 [Clostridia bacterium]|nr:hypothetical protein [Clostridia bacterium]